MNKVKFLVVVVLSVLFAACSEEENLSQAGKSGFVVSLTESVKVESRRTPEQIGKPGVDKFKLKITRQSDGQEVYNGSYTSDLIPAPVGMYTLEAEQGNNPVLARDAPYYKGTAEAEVTSETESTSVAISCTVANALASVVFDDSGAYQFVDQFSSYGVRVAFPSISTILKNGDGLSAYYRAGTKPEFTFEGTLKNGTPIEPVLLDDEKLSDDATFAAGQHCVITLKLGATSSGIRVEVSKVEVVPVTINETIPLEWLPKPKVTATGFDANNTLAFVETEQKQAALNLNLSSALQDMKFKFNFEDAQFTTSLQADKEYLLSNAEDKAAIETALDIALPNVGDKPESIDLSNLLAKLQTNAGTSTTNTIEIDVQANNRWSSEDAKANRTYKIVCNKPEFSIAVQPGNVWTKTFTIDEPTITIGNADVLREKLVYQYKEKDADDNTWQTCSNGLEQVFPEHPSNKAYQVRAFYREGIASNVVDIELETPEQTPNANMDAWTESTRETKYLGFITNEQPFFQPWFGNIPHWWDTNNIATMPTSFTGGEGASLACFPTTTFITNDHNEKSAVIRSIGHGTINTGAIVSNKTRGILYAGTTSENGTINEGRDWESRPTQLSFTYNYESRNNERFGVYIELYSGDTKIGSGEYESTKGQSIQDFTALTSPIKIDYTDETLKATSIRIRFCSVAEGDDPEVDKKISVNVPEGSDNHYTIHGGSVLRIDDIQLIYDK